MTDKDILQRIIDENGSCCWSDPKTCEQCPLSRLKQRKDGTYRSCIESVRIDGFTEEEADARYKEVAERLLLDLSVEEYLL